MTKIPDLPNLQSKQTFPSTFSLEQVSCTLCKAGPHSTTELCQLHPRHRKHSSCPRLCYPRSWQQKQPFKISGTIPTPTKGQYGWGNLREPAGSTQPSSLPWQQQEAQSHAESRREEPCYTNRENAFQPYTPTSWKSTWVATDDQLGLAIIATHTLVCGSCRVW